jgi:hypothetical protein
MSSAMEQSPRLNYQEANNLLEVYKTGDLQKIQQAHVEYYNVGYDEPELLSYGTLMGTSNGKRIRPLEYALDCNADVANFLLDIKNVSVDKVTDDDHGSIHHWVFGILRKSPIPASAEKIIADYEPLLEKLIHKGADINHIAWRNKGHTWFDGSPLSLYLCREPDRTTMLSLKVPVFFKYGALIFSRQHTKRWNVLHALMNEDSKNSSSACTLLITTLLQKKAEHVESIRKPCELYCLLFKRINEQRKGTNKIPRVLRDYIIGFVIPDFKEKIEGGMADIRESLADRDSNQKRTVLERINNCTTLSTNKQLCAIVDPGFWEGSSRVCLERFNKLMNKEIAKKILKKKKKLVRRIKVLKKKKKNLRKKNEK